ncbi:hypothetical protein [Gluconacetobacter takamatsuzukensis]|uniref:UrcA family protein n=1 Tax=Gluconacetobacter takamatsuzukensis TaxID=1286190 RepID=A0A7W4PMN3_9PROT|nr:hypothetical protein [Gluconacetobacter takamatsuzukensis]MBB2203752.1 hypothetical protein [Gluconacetobacter takamatsuzukensis]
MTIRIDARRLLPLLAGTGLAIAATTPAHAHKEHSIYGSISGYRAILDRNSDAYRSADAFCQTDASVSAATNGTVMTGGGGNQFKRLKTDYALCMESRGAWIRITGNAAGDRPADDH